MIVEDGITKLDTGRSSRVLLVTGLVPGLSADLSSVVQTGDLVLAIDGFGTLAMDLTDVRDRISGPRGSRVCLKMLRPLDSGTGVEYTVILKRGAWGPEHAMVSPEDRDILDKHRFQAGWRVWAGHLTFAIVADRCPVLIEYLLLQVPKAWILVAPRIRSESRYPFHSASHGHGKWCC
jgi:hypothetical protein